MAKVFTSSKHSGFSGYRSLVGAFDRDCGGDRIAAIPNLDLALAVSAISKLY
jgi:hypothetical protein